MTIFNLFEEYDTPLVSETLYFFKYPMTFCANIGFTEEDIILSQISVAKSTIGEIQVIEPTFDEPYDVSGDFTIINLDRNPYSQNNKPSICLPEIPVPSAVPPASLSGHVYEYYIGSGFESIQIDPFTVIS